MTAARDQLDLGDARVALLPVVGRIGDGPRHDVIELAVEDEERTPIGVLRVHLVLSPRIHVRAGRLEERLARRSHRERLEEVVRLFLGHRVRERIPELFVGERDGPSAVERVAERRPRRPERRNR
jgi:hypothetical protein